ncbi:hypothetical protein BX070DRAFT_235867 [Coemansia spiralis]|nr:hypothetical protein BX070DRAFT_235867 [Coemansia spiralis]
MAFQNLFVPRARLATFNVLLRIEDLNNVPPLNGVFYAKWKCQDHNGTTPRHVLFSFSRWFPLLTAKCAGFTQWKKKLMFPSQRTACSLRASLGLLSNSSNNSIKGSRVFVRRKEREEESLAAWCMKYTQIEVYSHVRMKVGTLTINLSEYALLSGSSRRYFLQESKLNCTLKISGPDSYQVPALDRSMVLTDLNDMIANEGNSSRAARENSSMGNSFGSKQHSTKNNLRNANSGSSIHTNTTRSNTTEASQSRALLPIDDTNVRELAPFQRSSKKNQQIVDDVFFSSPGLPT